MAGRGRKQRGRGERRKKGCWAMRLLGQAEREEEKRPEMKFLFSFSKM
jgi:hypothetical protein